MYKICLSLLVIAATSSCSNNKTGQSSAQTDTSGVKNYVRVYTTADSSNDRLTLTDSASWSPLSQPTERDITVFIDPAHSFQTFFGIGGALTDASAETFYKLPKPAQQELLNAYYNKVSGIGYTVGRTNINSCDFSSDTYTYVKDGDTALSSFNISHDLKYKVPFIKEVMAAADSLKLFASPWSPPAYMKDNNDMLHGGTLLPKFYNAWALYYTRFIKEYEKLNIPVWGISVQNEPMAVQKWESCNYTAEQERDFLKNHLGPVMAKEGLGNKKIIVWDHNRDLMYQRALTCFNDPEASKYAWGIGFHWYEDWSKGTQMFDNVRRVHETFPDKNILFTEGCAESFDATRYNSRTLGERYGRSMINDFNNGMVGFTDWNVLLDETGGPNHVQNFCFAPVHADTRTGKLIYTNAYYYIGHFSKFIRPGAKRIAAASSRSPLLTTAFRNTDGSVAAVVMNQGDTAIQYNLWVNNKAVKITAPAHAIQTLLF